jgi:hypothetical protein
MKRNFVVGTMVVAAALMAAPAVYAQPLAKAPTGTHAMFKSKMVNFKITNGGTEPLTVKAGKNTLVLEPGKTTDFTLASGDEVVSKNRTKHYDEGQVLAHVNEDLEGHNITIM